MCARKDNLQLSRPAARWLHPLGALLTLAGYVGPWVNHAVAGLVITGLDLPEYIKFLPAILNGELVVWREGFYLPLVAASLALSLQAFDPRLRYRWLVRVLLLASATVAALNLLPPAWTPQRLLTSEFRLQLLTLGLLLICVGFSPFLALLASRLRGAVIVAVSVLAAWIPVRSFLRILDEIAMLYDQPQTPAWGMYLMLAGLALLGSMGILLIGEDDGRWNPD